MRNLWLVLVLGMNSPIWGFPNVCDVVKTPQFGSEVELSVEYDWCPSPFPLPPWPCAHVSYNLPIYFIEVVNHPGETMFGGLPFVKWQMSGERGLPFATEDDNGSFSFHAHAIRVPFTQWAFAIMPCGNGLPDLFCFGAASEHLGSHWKTGKPDMKQPHFLAWGLKPKACLAKGALVSATGQWGITGGGLGAYCSNSWHGKLSWYPPTDAPICTGWGVHFPRTGIATSSDQTTASLLVASRIKSIGGDVFRTISGSVSDKWQMIHPHSTSCFKEGQNIALLRAKGLNEISRLSGKPDKYLYAIWQKSRCTVDAFTGTLSHLWLKAVKAMCGAS